QGADFSEHLIHLAGRVNPSSPAREMDALLSSGEQVSSALLAMAVHRLGLSAVSFAGPQTGIITDRAHSRARIVRVDARRIRQELKRGRIVIVAGFQGVDDKQDITTLGRGGSDLTAVALAHALDADECEIYTDVSGIYTTDPRLEPRARKIKRITYDEMLEMASLGAQVMQSRSIELCKKFRVRLHVRSSFNYQRGTVVCNPSSRSKEAKAMEDISVRGVTLNKNEAKLTLCDVADKPGVAAVLFGELSREGINVDMIVQNISRTKQTDISFTVAKSGLKKALRISRRVSRRIGAGEVTADADVARVSVVGVGMRTNPGVAAKMFEALAENKINIEMISTSEISISCLIKKGLGESAVRSLHVKFGLGKH
ncbi:MAG: aspartate kinase, partial [Candidatus Omnitrophota bacterium]